MLKKMMLLASAVAALAAFAIPATASADTWADNGVAIMAGADITQSYEGFLQFNTGPLGVYGCEFTATVTTNGPHAATITKFAPTTEPCVGTIAFEGCTLIGHTSNTPWDLGNATTPLAASKAGGNITMHFEYKAKTCRGTQTTSHLEFSSLSIAVEGTNPITKLTVSGKSTTGIPISGSLVPEQTGSNPSVSTLGLVN